MKSEQDIEWEDDRDWPNLWRFREENAALLAAGEAVDVVMLGDSLTEGWGPGDPPLFDASSKPRVLNRGISGQTSPQMLLRFMADVVALRPRGVQLFAGTNDVAGNTGPIRFEDWCNNMDAMIALARVHDLRIVLATPLPAAGFPWSPQIKDVAPRLAAMRDWVVARAAASKDLVLADYYSVLLAAGGAMDPAFTRDGVHPTAEGYVRLRPTALAAFAAALG
jgi:lysophospholipase L1-like esterase